MEQQTTERVVTGQQWADVLCLEQPFERLCENQRLHILSVLCAHSVRDFEAVSSSGVVLGMGSHGGSAGVQEQGCGA
eukprot:COSAG02_NODE_45259_length_359_cov_0.296154_1_plen_76_part_01